jgi:hypothetical protein
VLSMLKYASAVAVASAHSILDFGTVTLGQNPTSDQEFANRDAMVAALTAANSTAEASERFVEIPAGHDISMHAFHIEHLNNVTIKLNGNVFATENNWKDWPAPGDSLNGKGRIQFWEFYYCDGITIEGNGTMDGRGF